MRNLPAIVKIVVLGLALPTLLSTAALGQGKDGGVTLKKDSITIHPGTKLSSSDEKVLTDVLKKYDKKLYRVEKYKAGKLSKSVGELKLDKQAASDRANAKTLGSTDSTITFVYYGNIALGANLSMTEKEDGQKLVKELKPIFQKYEKR